jgi:hypothetical protein
MARVLVIGDIHEPVTHPAYLKFCTDIYEAWNCDTVHFIGDVVDWHGISFHARHPEAPGTMDEYEMALAGVQKWYKQFPKATVSIGNHDERIIRLGESVNIPARFIRDYADVWETPGWTWEHETIIDDVYYYHGVGSRGKFPAYNTIAKMCMSVVMGHVHSAGGVKWMVNPRARFFGMDTGCGIDDRAVAMAYGKHNKIRSVLSCGVVLDGMPYHEIMPATRGEKYHRSRFKRRRGVRYSSPRKAR